MSIGFRAYFEIPRPDTTIILSFAGLPVANIADNMNRMYCVDSAIRSLNGLPLLGPAYTVKVCPGDNLVIHKALHRAKPGDILVIDGGGYTERSLIGEIVVRQSIAIGLGGWLIDGMVRDIEEIARLPMPVYARGVSPCGPYKNGPGEIGVPVCIGGQVVMPGDIIVGDQDGVVVVRSADAVELAELARRQNEREKKVLKDIANGIMDTGWIERFCEEKGLEVHDGPYL